MPPRFLFFPILIRIQVLPWAVRRYLLFKRGERLAPLYRFERSGQPEAQSQAQAQGAQEMMTKGTAA
jgi:hypothetical protein